MDSKYFWQIIIGLLILITSVIWVGGFVYNPEARIIACDVGQGDAILVVQGKTQLLVDGGRNDAVLSCLNRFVPFWDRTLELVVATHEDIDHYGGLIDVFKSYNVESFGSSGIKSSSQKYKVLEDLVNASQAQKLVLNQGSKLKVGMMYLDILWPNMENTPGMSDILSLPEWNGTASDNNLSVVIELKIGKYKALLTGDMESEVIAEIIDQGLFQDIDYLKVSHHGSKNGLTLELLDSTTPEVAVISVGAKNRYGHPNSKILGMLTRAGTKILRTDEVGDVVINVQETNSR